jgi:hypothetical protein
MPGRRAAVRRRLFRGAGQVGHVERRRHEGLRAPVREMAHSSSAHGLTGKRSRCPACRPHLPKPRHGFIDLSADCNRLCWMAVSPRIVMLGLSRVQRLIKPRRRMVARRADVYRVQSSELRTSVNEFVTRFVTRQPLLSCDGIRPFGIPCIAATANAFPLWDTGRHSRAHGRSTHPSAWLVRS